MKEITDSPIWNAQLDAEFNALQDSVSRLRSFSLAFTRDATFFLMAAWKPAFFHFQWLQLSQMSLQSDEILHTVETIIGKSPGERIFWIGRQAEKL